MAMLPSKKPLTRKPRKVVEHVQRNFPQFGGLSISPIFRSSTRKRGERRNVKPTKRRSEYMVHELFDPATAERLRRAERRTELEATRKRTHAALLVYFRSLKGKKPPYGWIKRLKSELGVDNAMLRSTYLEMILRGEVRRSK